MVISRPPHGPDHFGNEKRMKDEGRRHDFERHIRDDHAMTECDSLKKWQSTSHRTHEEMREQLEERMHQARGMMGQARERFMELNERVEELEEEMREIARTDRGTSPAGS